VTVTAGTGLGIAETGNVITLTNAAPDQTVSITGAGINAVTGTYPSFIVTGTSNFATVTKKRAFATKVEFKKEFSGLEIRDKESIEIAGESYTVSYAPKRYHKNLDDYVIKDFVIDGYFIDTVNFTGQKNRVMLSEDMFNNTAVFADGTYAPYIFLNGNAGIIRQNVAVAPDGTMTAEALAGFNSNASNQIQVRINRNGIIPGDSIIFSFYAKMKKGTGSNERLRSISALNSASGQINIVPDNNWRRYSVLLTAGNITFVTIFGIFDGFGNNDTLNLWGVSLEKGGKLTEYKQGGYNSQTAEQNYVWIYRDNLIKDDKLDLTGIFKNGYTNDRYTDDAPFIQSAINFCANGERCREVILPKDVFYIRTPIELKRGVMLSGEYPSFRELSSLQDIEKLSTMIYVDLLDTTKYVFTCLPSPPLEVEDETGMQNIQLRLLSKARGYLKTTEITSCRWNYLTFSTQGTGRVTENGIWVSVAGASDNHYNNFKNVSASVGDKIALRYSGGIANLFTNCLFVGQGAGIVIDGGTFNGNQISLEGSKNGIIQNQGNNFINGLYTESTAIAGGNVIRVNGGNLVIQNSIFQIENTATDTMFNLVGGGIVIQNSAIRTPATLSIKPAFNSVFFGNTTSTEPLFDLFSFSDITTSRVIISGNGKTFSGQQQNRNLQSNVIDIDGKTERNALFNSIVCDGLFFSNATWRGRRENLISNSEVSTGGDAFFNIQSNTVIAPDGTLTADLVRVTSNISSTFFQERTAIRNFQLNRPYTISVFLKDMKVAGKSKVYPVARAGVLGTNVDLNKITKNWDRYDQTIYGSQVSDIFVTRLNNLTSGDSIAIWGFQVNDGFAPLSYTKTTSTGILDTNVVINIASPELTLTKTVKTDAWVGTGQRLLVTNANGRSSAFTALSTTAPGTGQILEFNGTEYVPVTRQIKSTNTLNFASTLSATSSDLTANVVGAAVGDPVLLAPGLSSILANSNYTAWVSATNTVTIRFNNYSTSTIDPVSSSFQIVIQK